MNTRLSIRLNAETKACSEEWQLGELQSGINDLDADRVVEHESVSDWLKRWGKPDEGKAPQ